ncbi:MAG TPA: transglycosylase SLT domain-containing protein [Vicinamibacteria bacterium]|nr:transglycosylase SLT domain-containing protein [Vicinamibacteria bacterium]
MSAPLLGLLAILAAVPDVPAPNPPSNYWIEAKPEGPAEAALRDALARGGFGGPAAAVDALRQVSASYPGTAVSGLAQLAAGLALLEGPRPREAIPFLTHPDVQHTLLPDHALFALGRAQEAADQPTEAAQSYLAAAHEGPKTAVACAALLRAADALAKSRRLDQAADTLDHALVACPDQEPHVMERLGEIQEERGARKAAAEAYDRLDNDYPASTPAHDTAPRLRALASVLPAPAPERLGRELRKAWALSEAGRNWEAVGVLRAAQALKPSGDDSELLHVRLGLALLALGRYREAEASLAGVGPKSPYAAEAAFDLARLSARAGPALDVYESVAERFPDTPWAEEALLALANHYQRDARDEEALPFYRRLLAEYPGGRYVERATWRTAWADYRAGRYEQAAQALERTARLRPPGTPTPGFLYWAGRSRAALGQTERARLLFEETVQRYKYAYHGIRAREWLARLPPATASLPSPVLAADAPEPGEGLGEPAATRVHQLLLIDRLDEAEEELHALPFSPRAEGTIAWIEWRCGRLRPAITAMKRACPEWVGEAGDRLPPEVWRILFPLGFGDTLRAKAAEEGLDPALMAALILQESTFDAQALSRAGARGLMQVIPATGRKLARDLGVRFRSAALQNPKTSMDFGARYLRQMMDRYDGQTERVLAAYNAGPHRVDAWTASRPDMSAEEFVESIPFTETRYYVMSILAAREHYRRLYGLEIPTHTSSTVAGGARP